MSMRAIPQGSRSLSEGESSLIHMIRLINQQINPLAPLQDTLNILHHDIFHSIHFFSYFSSLVYSTALGASVSPFHLGLQGFGKGIKPIRWCSGDIMLIILFRKEILHRGEKQKGDSSATSVSRDTQVRKSIGDVIVAGDCDVVH